MALTIMLSVNSTSFNGLLGSLFAILVVAEFDNMASTFYQAYLNYYFPDLVRKDDYLDFEFTPV